MYRDIDLKYESGSHLLGEAVENTLIDVIYGNYQSSLWPDASWDKISSHSASVIGVDSLIADNGDYTNDDQNNYSEEDQALIEQLTLAALSWASLPESVKSINNRDSILQVHGDVSGGSKGYISFREVFVASLIPVLAASSAITGVNTFADYRSQKIRDAKYNDLVAEYNELLESIRSEHVRLDTSSLRMPERVTSRRQFMKSSVTSLIGTAFVINGALNIARWAESGNTPLQSAGEFIVDKTPGILYPGRHTIIGRTALVAEKTEEAVNMFETPTNRASILFGNAHSIGLEVVESKEDRAKAIRKLASILYRNLNEDENRDGVFTQEDIVRKLADTRTVTVNEIDTEVAKEYPTIALINSVKTEGRYFSPAVTAVLDSWDPTE